MYLEKRGTAARPLPGNMRRRGERYICSIPFSLQRFLRYGPVVTRGMTLDVSMQGMSALVCGAPLVGETVLIALPFPVGAVEMLAKVRHSNEARSGFEFFPLSPLAEQAIQDWIAELQQCNETQFRWTFPYPAKYGSD